MLGADAIRLTDDDFALFGLSRRFQLDRSALDQAWRARQAQVHPDRFVGQDAAAQRLAMQWSVRVNEAYRRLKDPVARAAYLCDLLGAPIDAERNTAMPRNFLMQQMQWREALDDAQDAASVVALSNEVQGARDGYMADLSRRLDGQPDAAAAAQVVRALMFVQRFEQDLDDRLDALSHGANG